MGQNSFLANKKFITFVNTINHLIHNSMKKILFLLLAVAALSSCSLTRSSVKTANVTAPVLSTTVVSLDVAPQPITYTYTPTKNEAKKLTFNDIMNNAMYEALKKNGSGDVMVQVSYKVEGKGFGRFVGKVKKLTITGYPAKYVNFRTPDANDRENIEIFYNNNANTVVTVKKK